MRLLPVLAVAGISSAPGAALAECDLTEVVGYTLVAAKTIEGRIDEGKREDDFEGCDFDRIIVFSDNTGVRCVDGL